MIHNAAIAATLEDRLVELGGISATRVRTSPDPGLATLADLQMVNESREAGLYELVDGTLVKKAWVSRQQWWHWQLVAS